jgi:hypothetical protein
MRTEPYPNDALEIVDLELYLAGRPRSRNGDPRAVSP